MQESDTRQEISIGYVTTEKAAVPAMQKLISAWNILAALSQAGLLCVEVCAAGVYRKTGFTVHYAITFEI